MRRPVALTLAAAGALLVAGLIVAAGVEAARPARVWAFVPEPAWREDPPIHAAESMGGDALPKSAWDAVLVTRGGGPSEVVVVRQPSALWRRFLALLGRSAQGDLYVAVGTPRAVPGGRWQECVRVPSPRR